MNVPQMPSSDGLGSWEENMNSLLARGKKWVGKAALATVALGGFLAFFGAGTATARPYRYERQRFHASFVAPGFYGYYGPRAVYAGPVYRPYRRHVEYRYWDARFHCWRYR